MKISSITKMVKIKKLYCIIHGKYRILKKSKIYIFKKPLVLSITCIKCYNEDKKIFKK